MSDTITNSLAILSSLNDCIKQLESINYEIGFADATKVVEGAPPSMVRQREICRNNLDVAISIVRQHQAESLQSAPSKLTIIEGKVDNNMGGVQLDAESSPQKVAHRDDNPAPPNPVCSEIPLKNEPEPTDIAGVVITEIWDEWYGKYRGHMPPDAMAVLLGKAKNNIRNARLPKAQAGEIEYVKADLYNDLVQKYAELKTRYHKPVSVDLNAGATAIWNLDGIPKMKALLAAEKCAEAWGLKWK